MTSPALDRWPSLRNSGLLPEELEKIDRLMVDFFLPPIEMDVRYSDILQAVAEGMAE